MNDKIFEITHDSLAAKIWEKVSAEDRTLLEVKTFIASAFKIYRERGDLLSRKGVAYIAPFENKLLLEDDVHAFIRKSKRNQRNQRTVFYALISGFILLLITGFFLIRNERNKAVEKSEDLTAANANIEKQNKQINKTLAELNLFNERLSFEKNQRDIALQRITKDSIRLEAALKDARANTIKAQLETEKADSAQKNSEAMTKIANNAEENTKKNLQETKDVLQITRTSLADPTAGLRKAITSYNNVDNPELKQIIRQNTYSSFHKILYQNNIKWKRPFAAIAVSNDLNSILITDSTQAPELWIPASNKIIKLLGHRDAVTYSCHYEDDKSNEGFITLANHREAIIWNKNGKYLNERTFSHAVNEMKNIPLSNKLLLLYDIRGIGITDLNTNNETRLSDDYIKDVEVSTAQNLFSFVSLNNDNVLSFWTWNGKQYVQNQNRIPALSGNISRIAISPNEKYIATVTESGILFYTINKSAQNFTLSPKPALTLSLRYLQQAGFNANENMIITTSNSTCYTYDLAKMEFGEIKGHEPGTSVSILNIGSDKNKYVTAGSDSTIKIWNDEIKEPLVFVSPVKYEKDTDAVKCSVKGLLLTKNKKQKEFEFNSTAANIAATFFIPESLNNSNKNWLDSATIDNFSYKLSSNQSVLNGLVVTTSIKLEGGAAIEDNYIGTNETNDRKLDILWAVFSSDHRFVLIKLKTPGLKTTTYEIYPTFWGMKDFMKIKNINL